MRCAGRRDKCRRDAVPGFDYCGPCREARHDDKAHAEDYRRDGVRIADLRREIASPRPAHLSETFHATHIAAAQASLDRLLAVERAVNDTDPVWDEICAMSSEELDEALRKEGINPIGLRDRIMKQVNERLADTDRGTDEDQH